MKLFINQKLKTSIFVLLVLGIQNFYAESPLLKEAKEKGRIFRKLEGKELNLQLMPDSSYSKEFKEHAFADYSENVAFAAEVLYYVEKKELVENSSNQDKAKVDTSIKTVSKIMRSISKMKGMKYYSNSRKRWDTLYLESYRIENPESKEPIEDMLEGSANNLTLYAFQEEHTFGDGFYQLDYKEDLDEVLMNMKNVSSLSYGFIKAVKPEKCRISVCVKDDGDGYYVYIGMCADTIKLSIIEKKMSKSFQARLDAIFKWLTLQF